MKQYLLLGIAFAHFSWGFPVQGSTVQYNVGTTYKYTYHTQVRSNEPAAVGSGAAPGSGTSQGSGPQTAKDVGVTLDAEVHITAVWNMGQSTVLEIKIVSPRISSVARDSLSRDLQVLSKLPVYLQMDEGRVARVFVGEGDTSDSTKIKKGVASLLQLQVTDTPHIEMDTSGSCMTSYKVADSTITKTKASCTNSIDSNEYYNINRILDVTYIPHVQSVYNIDNDIIQSVEVNERYEAVVNLDRNLAVHLTSTQRMVYKDKSKGGMTATGLSASDVIKKINKKSSSQFTAQLLTSVSELGTCDGPECEAFDTQLSELRSAISSTNTATAEAADAFVRLVSSARQASEESLLKALKAEHNRDIVPQLIDIIVAAQTYAGQTAMMKFLDFTNTNDENVAILERYLLAVAFSTHPSEDLLMQLLKLYQQRIAEPRIRESIGEALGAVVYTFCQVGEQCQRKVVKDVQEAFISELKSCDSAGCEAMNLRALSNAAFPDTIPLVLMYAELSNNSNVCEAAIRALRRFNASHINDNVRTVMKRIYLQSYRSYDTAVRSRALRVILDSDPSLSEVTQVVNSTTDPYQTELDTFVQAMLFNRMGRDDTLRSHVKAAMNNSDINNYNILAPKGKSLSFTENLAVTNSVTSTYDMYVENSRAGLLKRSGMDVHIHSPVHTLTLYSFGIFAGGMESMVSSSDDTAEPADPNAVPTAGLALDLLEVSLRPVVFFEGQAGLMGAVWSAPSELTSALQMNVLMLDHMQHVHLQNGLIAKLDLHGAVSMDLSGLISISLWNKNCHSLIKNSGAIVVHGSFAIETPSFQTGVEFSAQTASVMDFQSDVDFYDKLKTCLQMSRPDLTYKRHVSKYEYIRGLKRNYRANVRRTSRIDGVSYPLPKSNYAMCRELLLTQE